MEKITPGTGTRAYSYLRFSTPEQLEGDSLRRQTALAESYASRHGLLLDDSLTFKDLGVSAFRSGNANVGMLGEFLEAVRVGHVPKGSYLLVESLDRISRDHAFDAQTLLSNMISDGITVVTLLDERVYSLDGLRRDPMGMMYSIMGFMRSNEESAVKSRRLKEAWSRKVAQIREKPFTSRAPAWVRLDREAGAFILDDDRAELVRRIYRMSLEGIGQNLIAKTFNLEGIPTWGRSTHWHGTYIQKILANPAVLGIFTPHVVSHVQVGSKLLKKRTPLDSVEGYFPAVVSPETFGAVKVLTQTRGAPARGRHAYAPVSNLLAGLTACPKCGATMSKVNKGSRSKPSFVCSRAKVGAGCQYKSVPYDLVERRLLEALPVILQDREGAAGALSIEREIGELEDGIYAWHEEIETLTDNLSHERSPALTARLAKRETQLTEAKADLQKLRDKRDAASGLVVGSRADRVLAAITVEREALDHGEANLALRSVFKRATIDWPNGAIELEWTHGGTCRVQYLMTADTNEGEQR